MALAPVLLDDLAWTEMVESIRRRIPGASDGLWTHHGPVDPGMTLLELIAWLVEQRLFWIDQESADLTRALFTPAGERPLDTQPATTVLACGVPAGAPFLELPAGTVFSLSTAGEPRAFTSTTGAVLAPIADVGLETREGDRTADLRARRPVPLMGADGRPAQVVIVLRLAHGGPLPAAGEKLALLLDLDTSGRVPPSWSPGAVADVAPPAQLTWSYSVAANGWRAFPVGAVEDGTGGLRRAGVVRLPIPSDWTPRGPSVGGLTPFALRVSTPRATFTVPPRLMSLSWNVVVAAHWIEVSGDAADLSAQARSWLKLPGQRLRLSPDQPPPLARTVRLSLRERDRLRPWTSADDFGSGDRERRVFVVDREAREMRFGDGVSARIPVPHDVRAPELSVTYRAGGGTAGLVAAGKVWEGRRGATRVEARNVVAASGGSEAESLDAAARRIAGILSTNRRAVIRDDYEELARTTPGVAIARALAAVGHHPHHPCARVPGVVTVFVVPFAPRPAAGEWTWPDPSIVAAPRPDPGALEAVRLRLERARLLGTQVFVRPAAYRPVSVRVEVAGSPADARSFEQRLGAALARYLDPLAGGESGDGAPFGEPVRPSALLRVAQQALRREAVVERVLVAIDDPVPAEPCNDVALGPRDLPFLSRLEVTFQPTASRGVLP